MSTAARIEELRKKFDENPRRYFAPLANELRKAGDLTQAIALCREHLPKQPGHMSGYIVYGQALYEGEALDEARSVFEQALALDPENLIALRHLGDIARRQGDPMAARRWYERVLDADPRNDDIAAHIASLATPAHPMRAIPMPGVAMPVVQAPAPDLRPVSFTPSVPVPVIGVVVPTPDSVMRAVDFDEVNARLRTPPIPSISQIAPATPVAPVIPEPSHDLLDLDAMEVAGDGMLRSAVSEEVPFVAATVSGASPVVPPAAAAVSDVADTAEEITEASDPFAFAGETSAAAAADDDASAGMDDLSFEEGLAAPTWPDTSDLVARVATPRSVTPAYVDVPVEAVDAFGRESSDPVAHSLPEPEPDIADEELPSALAMTQSDEADVVWTADAAHVLTPVASELAVPAPDFDEPAAELSYAEATYAQEEDVDVSVELESITEAADPHDEAIEPWAMEPVAASLPEAAVSDVMTESVELDAVGHVEADLPWLSSPVTPTEEVEAIADAIAEDARVAGDSDAVSVFAMPVADVTADAYDGEASFSDVHPEAVEMTEAAEEAPPASFGFETYGDYDAGDVVAEEGFEPEVEEVPSPAFVTETMGELLVTQGFIERAISVYEELVRRRPYDPVLSSRLAELREQVTAPAPEPVKAEALVQQAARYTARERFAALAARRVPRRTPRASVAIPAVEEEGLASLFGAATDGADDTAARALADAFSPQHVESGAVTDSFFGSSGTPARGTPAYTSAMRTPAVGTPAMGTPAMGTPALGAVAMSTPAQGVASTESTSEAFSFDRFFPDPASHQATSETGTPDRTAAPGAPSATDDLAQFSAWLKGLGNA
ncbi:MAG TPA: tetratricopeptide repeat protein [Gemmatimonas sp.]|uniref:tetratricopeptide repeat protein n=1 Tax=Gemmatimonas sp. TaxID=1962908 RepID=UPI002ED78BB4